MAFAYAVTGSTGAGGPSRRTWGTFTNADADTGGDIVTGLNVLHGPLKIEFTSHKGSNSVKQTVSGGTVTIVCDNGADGRWEATGF